MWERLFVSVVFLLLTGACYAQWTAEDSLRKNFGSSGRNGDVQVLMTHLKSIR